jgi:macrolide transport system ATP-binding/permease protein
MTSLLRDLRYGMRQLCRSTGFACTAIFIVALGICASVSIFGFVDAALIQPLPYRDPSKLVAVFVSSATTPRDSVSYLNFQDWRSLNSVFSSIDAYSAHDAANGGFMLSTPTGAEQVSETRISPGFLRTLGVRPILGRDFYSNEDSPSAPQTLMLSYASWQKRFGRRPDVIGQIVVLEGVPSIIIGVLPEDFHFAPVGPAEFWGVIRASDYCEQFRGCRNLNTVARLKNGVSLPVALADMKSVAGHLEKEYSDSNHGQGVNMVTLSEVIVGDVRPVLLLLLSGAGLLLFIAYVNVACLLLARSDSRKREIAVREALGAAPARLIRLFATEGLLLAATGGSLGLASAAWVMELLTRLIPPDLMGNMPYLQSLGFSFHSIFFACAICLLAGMLFTVTPTLCVSLSHLREGLSERSRGSTGTTWHRFGSNLVVMELAIATVLLVSAGLLGKSVYRLLHEDIGFEVDHLATLQIEGPKGVDGIVLEQEVLDRLSILPGVKSVGVSSSLPVGPLWGVGRFKVVGRPDHGEDHEAFYRQVSPGYFSTLQTRLLRGRYFTEAEDASKPRVVIINQALAKQYFPGADPIGKQIGEPNLTMEIVGVVNDIKEGPLDNGSTPVVYEAFKQDPWRGFSIAVRTSPSSASFLPTLAGAIHEINRGISVHNETTMMDLINDSPAAYLHRSSAWLVGSFAAIALLLSVVGLYGVVAYSVSQRTREIGVRMALGAQRNSVYRLILKESSCLAAIGIVVGLIGSLAATRLMQRLLYGVQSWDVPTLVGVVSVLGLSFFLAVLLPARRAAKVDPVAALRCE